MGQYFMWINFDKRQYLDDDMFPDGLKATESAYVGSPKTDAAATLLGTIWRGDLVVFAGEYLDDIRELATPGRDDGLLRVADYPIDHYDITYDFKDVGGRLSCARDQVGTVVGSDEFGEKLVYRPYEGPFDIEVEHHRYVVNESKREYYDRERTDPSFWPHSNIGPLPLLLKNILGTSRRRRQGTARARRALGWRPRLSVTRGAHGIYRRQQGVWNCEDGGPRRVTEKTVREHTTQVAA